MNPLPSPRLLGKTAIVTGGSRGIGAAIVERFVAEGAAVGVIHLEDEANATPLVIRLRESGGRALSVEGDVADPALARVCVERISDALGPADILVNCAGVGHLAAFEELSLQDWSRVMAINLTGTYIMASLCYRGMKSRRSGRIINIASQMAFSGGVGAAAYCASKAGVVGFTRALAVEAAPFGVLVNCIAPGATETDMLEACGEPLKSNILAKIPLGRFGRPAEIAPIAALLASEEGGFFVGQTISPNGGDVLR